MIPNIPYVPLSSTRVALSSGGGGGLTQNKIKRGWSDNIVAPGARVIGQQVTHLPCRWPT